MKRTIKHKMYQKRRKREKAENRKKTNVTKEPKSNGTCKNRKIINKHNLYNCYPTKRYEHPNALNKTANSINSYSESLQLWWQTYCSAMEFHCQQQNAYKNDSQEQYLSLLEQYAKEYETSSEDEDENVHQHVTVVLNSKDPFDVETNNEAVDEEYLKFLDITLKHREELRKKRTEENI